MEKIIEYGILFIFAILLSLFIICRINIMEAKKLFTKER